MNDTIVIIGLVVAVICGIMALLEANGRSWPGAGLVIGFGVLLLLRLT